MSRQMNTGTRGGNLHKEGVYLMQIEDVEEKTSQNSGNDYLNIRFSVLHNGRSFGSSVFDVIVLNEASAWRWSQLMNALDAPESESINPETWLIGKQVYARVVIDDYNDEDRNKVKSYVPMERAVKLLEKEETAEQSALPPSNNGAKARQRNRATSHASELSDEESMPL